MVKGAESSSNCGWC